MDEALKNSIPDNTPSELKKAILYSLLAGGKRIRPRLTLATARMLELSEQAATQAALAIEMIHCFTLIHDDLPCLDNDDTRRGQPSNHKVFGEGMAVLAGDALIPLAFETLLRARTWVSESHIHQALLKLAQLSGPEGVIGGQTLEFELMKNPSLDLLEKTFALKTGCLFSAPVLIAMSLAGIDEHTSAGKILKNFSKNLGFAFQVADDLEDQFMGKAPATHILHYMSHSDAQVLARKPLGKSISEIKDQWPQKSRELVAIAEEVLKSLQ